MSVSQIYITAVLLAVSFALYVHAFERARLGAFKRGGWVVVGVAAIMVTMWARGIIDTNDVPEVILICVVWGLWQLLGEAWREITHKMKIQKGVKDDN